MTIARDFAFSRTRCGHCQDLAVRRVFSKSGIREREVESLSGLETRVKKRGNRAGSHFAAYHVQQID